MHGFQVGRGKKANHKTILQKVSGSVHPGHLLAVMGPTGTRYSLFAGNTWFERGGSKGTSFTCCQNCTAVKAWGEVMDGWINGWGALNCKSGGGNAGSGKTSLINALAGRLEASRGAVLSGNHSLQWL